MTPFNTQKMGKEKSNDLDPDSGRVSRKRTRSEKGLQYDEMRQKSPLVERPAKATKKGKTEKPKASRMIAFNDKSVSKSNKNSVNSTESKNCNTNSTNVIKQKTNGAASSKERNIGNPSRNTKVKSSRTGGVIDPCFKNVWEKEMGRIGKVGKGSTKNFTLQDEEMNRLKPNGNRDGIVIEVDAEDLDYVDDFIDESIDGDLEIEEVVEPELSVSGEGAQKGGNHQEKQQAAASRPMGDSELMKSWFNQFWEEKMKEMNSKDRTERSSGAGNGKVASAVVGMTSAAQSQIVKSPSDTTIYAPALCKNRTTCDQANIGNTVGSDQISKRVSPVISRPDTDPNLLIQNFVDTMRLEHEQARQLNKERLQENKKCRASADNNESCIRFEQAQKKLDGTVVEAEQFKASIAEPGKNEGREPQLIPNIGSGVSDDDFFHLTCHIEPNLIHKIELGEFVELEKLLPKDRSGTNRNDESRLEWVQCEGGTFLVPAQRDCKINSFRKWELAFRAYATIYCAANPHRSKEIWQYISVINTAASSFIWDNVYNYDITFRHLMAFNPMRSWAITYNQMWNLSMRDPIPRNNSSGKSSSSYYGTNQYSNNPKGAGEQKRNKSDYCWNFNKGVPCKFGNKCKFVERCKYCDSPAHGVNACPKLQKKQGGEIVQVVRGSKIKKEGKNKPQ